MSRRAWIGTGLIGAAMVEAALARGEAVTVWNRSLSKAQRLGELGAEVAQTAAEAVAGHARVHLALTDDAAVQAQLEAIAPALAPEAIIVDHSTTAPAATAARARWCAQRGIGYLHAPVFMSPQACRHARGLVVVCGPEPLYRQVEAELSRMTGKVWYCGERPDAAATFKLIGNALNLTIVGGLADAFALAQAQGFSPKACLELFEVFDVRQVIRGRGARMAEQDYDTQWSLRMARKDLRLMQEAAGDAPLGVLPGLAARMDALVAEGEAERDVGVLARDSQAEETTP